MGAEINGTRTIDVSFGINTDAVSLNSPVGENNAHEFGAAALAFFEATVNDNVALSTFGVDLAKPG